ncbi:MULTISPECIES: LysR family transcriptional regulator [unclassified Cupriavidus]|uniref:LysR family transcriptional regulator n=1 Tax=unclassified Cupriavidus TaxID=2640874 RepID=UPI001BFFFF55|nr:MULTISPECIES: LysR family transcriptional regulator [unclassified Cupriavidus]MCA3190777.1 LysR family transcriptional regulator [Cupriavidus sp.]MCA3199136.1 LysR family transcriptional regulator [Cupriavidus sp.]MCA3205073.1 LysR family transcriptional regulator [Cupriavidus sp.]MCA3209144.1 LysR family transcriptional regulator [Cupriavidus sp.]MCA3231642.1 LysR family transcriptional regulator [Cupriavidus sp.]
MLRYFKTFLVAAETGSFSAAGARLGLTQSAVSTQIRRLEEDLGCTLFDRSGKSVALSDEGRQMLDDATRIVGLYESMKGARGQRDTAPLDLGAVSTVQSTLLPQAMQRFRVAHPDTHVNIVPGMSTQLLTQVDARELDIAVLVRPRLGIPPELKWVPLIRERFVAVAPPEGPDNLKALLETVPFIRYNRHSTGGQLVDRYLRRHRLWVREGMELDEPAVILQMVSEGLGCAIIPSALVPLRQTPNIKEVLMPGQPLYREIGVLVRQSALKRAPAAALIDAFVAVSHER